MGKLTISFHPLFILFAFVLVYFGWLTEFVVYMLVLILHELAHYVAAKIFGYKLNKILFMPYGAGISGENNIFKPSHEVIIALAGPILNFVLSIICVSLWWIVPESYAILQTFTTSNLVLGVFNLLPLFPLDGGRVAVALLLKRTSKIKAYKIMKILGITFSIVFAILFFVSVFYAVNLTFFFISVFLLTSSFGASNYVYFERSGLMAIKNNNFTKPVEVKTLIVKNNVPLQTLLKHIKGNNFTMFLFVDNNYRVVKMLTEKDVIDKLSTFSDN